MKQTIALLASLVALLAVVPQSQADKLTEEMLNVLDERYQYFITVPPMDGQPLRFLYGDTGPHVHVYEVTKGRARQVWETGNLGAPVAGLMFRDLNKDGTYSLILATRSGRLVAYDGKNYERVWENFQEPFRIISCITAANLDSDPQDEVILIGQTAQDPGSYIFIYDSVSRGLEWKSQEIFEATEILVANVDSDPQMEIILNSGFIIDSRFYNIQLVKRDGGGFGEDMTLIDMNDDGYPDLFGRVPAGRSLKLYDIYGEREIW